MLRVTIFMALLVLGSVRATLNTNIKKVSSFAESRPNKYFALRLVSTDVGRAYFMDILQDIKPNLGLLLCEKFEYDYRDYGDNVCGNNNSSVIPRNDTIHGPVCQELCCALDDLAVKNPDFPRPDELLGLRGSRCPLKKGSYRIPQVSLPKCLDVDFVIQPEYVWDYEGYISPNEDCSLQHNLRAFITSFLASVSCKN